MINRKIIFFSFIIICLTSCGVILDSGKVTGSWSLENSEYYLYNSITDSYKTLKGSKDASSDSKTPLLGSFFYTNETDIILDLKNNGEFTIKAGTDFIVQSPSGTWELDSYENTLTIKITSEIRETKINAHSFWSTGAKITNSWPLIDLTNMELIIKASDINKDLIDVFHTNYKVQSMKGIFKKI